MFMIAMILVAVFAGYIYRNYWLLFVSAKWYGTETDASVSRIENEVRTANGAKFPRRFCYVVFLTQNGLQNEARLLNPKGQLVPGSRIKVKYLPERNDVAVLTRIIE